MTDEFISKYEPNNSKTKMQLIVKDLIDIWNSGILTDLKLDNPFPLLAYGSQFTGSIKSPREMSFAENSKKVPILIKNDCMSYFNFENIDFFFAFRNSTLILESLNYHQYRNYIDQFVKKFANDNTSTLLGKFFKENPGITSKFWNLTNEIQLDDSIEFCSKLRRESNKIVNGQISNFSSKESFYCYPKMKRYGLINEFNEIYQKLKTYNLVPMNSYYNREFSQKDPDEVEAWYGVIDGKLYVYTDKKVKFLWYLGKTSEKIVKINRFL